MPLEGDDTNKVEARHGARQCARKLRNMMDANTVRKSNKTFGEWKDTPIVSITRAMCKRRHKELATRSPGTPCPGTGASGIHRSRTLINRTMEKFRVGDETMIAENPVRMIKDQMAPPFARKPARRVPRIGQV